MANISIYIANLGKYNEGYLVGEWIDLPVTEEEFEALFVRIKVGHYEEGKYVAGYEEGGSFYEEVAIHDYDSELFGLSIGEYDNIQNLNELAEELESKDLEFVEAIVEATGCDLEDAIGRQYEDAIFYKGQDLVDVAYDIIEECYDLPEFAKRYFDYEAFARDLSFDGYHEVKNGVIYIR